MEESGTEPVGEAATLHLGLTTGLFLPLIWLPMVVAGHISDFNRGETYATWVPTVAAWVVADSYRGVRWLETDK